MLLSTMVLKGVNGTDYRSPSDPVQEKVSETLTLELDTEDPRTVRVTIGKEGDSFLIVNVRIRDLSRAVHGLEEAAGRGNL